MTGRPKWYAPARYTVTNVVFDASFAEYRPRNCCSWFLRFASLVSVQGMENFDTSAVTNAYAMFYECAALQRLDFSGCETTDLRDVRCMFGGCSSLAELDVSRFGTSKVRSMLHLFNGCRKLKTLDLGSFDTSAVTNMNCMFADCQALKTIVVSESFVTDGVKLSNQMFSGCEALTGCRGTGYRSTCVDCTYARLDGGTSGPGYLSPPPTAKAVLSPNGGAGDYYTLRFVNDGRLDYGDRDVGWFSVEEAESAGVAVNPKWCGTGKNIADVEIDESFARYRPSHCAGWLAGMSDVSVVVGAGNLDLSGAASLARMFSGCSSLRQTDGFRFNCTAVTDLRDMFAGCETLQEVDLAGLDSSAVTDMGGMFKGCGSLTTIYADKKFTTDAVSYSEGMFEGCVALSGGAGTKHSVGHLDSEFARIDEGPDSETPGYFTEMPESPKILVEDEGTTYRFVVDDLRHGSRDVDWFPVSEIETIPENQFPRWSSLKTCENVTKVVFDPSFRKYRPKTCLAWFYGFKKLKKISGLENLDTSSCRSFHCMFENCKALNYLDLSPLSTESVVTMSDAFNGCSGLYSVDLSGFDTSALTNTWSMFDGCYKLTTVYVSGAFTTSGVKLSYDMFRSCDALVGGAGTRFDPFHTDCEYARIDGGPESETPGYFRLSPKLTQAKAVVEDGGRTLRFLCGDKTPEAGTWYRVSDAVKIDPNSGKMPPWSGLTGCERVVFDPTFKAYQPSQCLRWFSGFTALRSVEGLGNLNTSFAVSLASMFHDCGSLRELDLSGLETTFVTNVQAMFSGCVSLERIYARDGFVTSRMRAPSSQMFRDCRKLVGGNGYAWFENQTSVSAEFARIDTESVRGFFTRPRRAVAVYTGSHDLRFYYDTRDHSHEGEVFVFDGADFSAAPPWSGRLVMVWRVVFDPSFADYRPKSCRAWFRDAALLEAVVGLSYLDVSSATSLAEMFGGCMTLTSLDLSGFDTTGVGRMDRMFEGCSNLVTISVSSGFRTDSLKGSQSMFAGCVSLRGDGGFAYDEEKTDQTYARLGGAGTEGYFSAPVPIAVAVYTAADTTLTFYYDRAEHAADGEVYPLSAMVAPGGIGNQPWGVHAGTVTAVVFDPSFAGYRTPHCLRWFRNFGKLASVRGAENLDVSAATSLMMMFAGCSELSELNLVGLDTRNVTTMANMFYKCGELTRILVSDDFTNAGVVNLKENVFDGCTNLVGGSGTAFATEAAAHRREACYARIDRAGEPGYFTEAGLVASAVLSSDGATLKFYYDAADHSAEGTVYGVATAEAQTPGMLPPWSAAGETVTAVTFDGSFRNYRPRHCGGWFSGFAALTEVIGLEYLDLAQATSVRDVFRGCSSLAEIDLSSLDTTGVRDMSGMFAFCSSLTNVDVSSFDVSSVTNMETMFASTKVTELDLSSFDSGSLLTMEGMFSYCRRLERIYVLPGFRGDALTAGSPFAGNDALRGGLGTAFSYESHGSEFARADAPGAPGLFTMKKTAKAVVSSDGLTLAFHYDDLTHEADGAVFRIPESQRADSESEIGWLSAAQPTVTRAVFDASFAMFRPKSCAYWFYRIRHLERIDGLSYLDVSEATDLSLMFGGCEALTELDASGFDTRRVVSMHLMFWKCSALATIYASAGFSVESLEYPEDGIFNYSPQLRGGAGTLYSADAVSSAYARIDGGAGRPGYFTDKAASPSETYVIRFLAGGGNGEMSDMTCSVGRVHKLPECAFDNGDRRFLGWKCSNDRRYDDRVLVFDLAGAGGQVFMVAIWE